MKIIATHTFTRNGVDIMEGEEYNASKAHIKEGYIINAIVDQDGWAVSFFIYDDECEVAE